MIFAFDKDNGSLLALPAAADAAASCKAVDVADGYWLFFAENGTPLEARFERRTESGEIPGAYTLQQALSGLWLQERIGQITSVQGCGLSTIEELVQTWKTGRGK